MNTQPEDIAASGTGSGAAEYTSLRACLFLQNPFPECYCMNMSSSNIRKMVSFCNGDFRSCLIYRKHCEKVSATSR